MEEQTLMDYFHFDETDLNLNRNGQLSEKQKTRLTAELNSNSKGRTRFAYFMFFLALIGVAIAVGVWFIPDSGLGMRIGFGIGFGVVWPALYGLVGFAFIPTPAYMELGLASQNGRVNIVKAVAQNTQTHTQSVRYDLYVGGRRFLVEAGVGAVLIQGDEYNVYYLKNSNRIVSAEFVSRGK
ncbi:MAG: hypothetical protein J0L96_14355 [Anaerolineae bacterium]|nr:hypothetical protein [Anaerolineae bacterium]